MINAAFMGQAHVDIRRKLQKLEGFAGMNASQLLEVATKVSCQPRPGGPKEGRTKNEEKDRSPGSGIERMGRAQFQSG
jgi:hypothetical protein